jgi:hypothetical protein
MRLQTMRQFISPAGRSRSGKPVSHHVRQQLASFSDMTQQRLARSVFGFPGGSSAGLPGSALKHGTDDAGQAI